VYEKIGSSEARNHVYGLGEMLASAYHDQPSGWGPVAHLPGGFL